MTNKNLKIGAIVALLAAAVSAHAQTIRPSYSFPDAPTGGTQVGDTPLFISPSIYAFGGHDDNLFLSNSNEKSSYTWGLSPGLKLDARSPGMVFQSSYLMQIGRFTSSSPDDYVDQSFLNQVDVAFNQRTFLRLGYDFVRGHDPRGSTDRPTSATPDLYKVSTPRATFAFGAPGAQGRVELYYSDAHRDYLNNLDTTAVSDRDTTEGGGAFYWRVGPKTYVLVEARDTKIDYDIPNPLSAREHRYFLGVSWEATAKTTGTFKVGEMQRDFDGPIASSKSTAWEGWMTWAPRSYSHLDFYTGRVTNESTGEGNFILSSIGSVVWSHDWTSYCLLYTSPSPRDSTSSRMPSSA